MKYEEVVRYIEDIPKFTKKHTLLHTREFMRRLGNPCQGRKVLHVAGTNGKGSVCAYMQAILLFEGKRVGFFTSPHLVKLNERIRINGKDIDDDTFCRIFAKVRQVAEELDQNREDYAKEIRDMQQCIRRVTDKSVKIQAQEARNKELMREKFATIHRQAKAVRKNSRAITGYYNSMKEW